MEDYRIFEEFKSLILDGIMEEQYTWGKHVARFNPDLEINFDTDGAHLPLLPDNEYLDGSSSGNNEVKDGGVEA